MRKNPHERQYRAISMVERPFGKQILGKRELCFSRMSQLSQLRMETFRMGRKLPPSLKANALKVREAIWLMMERGSTGDF